MKYIKILGTIVRDTYLKIKRVIVGFWEHGVGDLVQYKRWFKTIVDVALMFGWWYLLRKFFHTAPIAIIGIALIMALMSRVFHFSGDDVLSDILSPFLTMLLYAISAYLFWWYLEIGLLVGCFLIPNITNDIIIKWHEYTGRYVGELAA